MPTPTVPTTIRLPVELAEALDAEHRRTGRTKTEIVVAGLEHELGEAATNGRSQTRREER